MYMCAAVHLRCGNQCSSVCSKYVQNSTRHCQPMIHTGSVLCIFYITNFTTCLQSPVLACKTNCGRARVFLSNLLALCARLCYFIIEIVCPEKNFLEYRYEDIRY
jgi:hypothetical protein